MSRPLQIDVCVKNRKRIEITWGAGKEWQLLPMVLLSLPHVTVLVYTHTHTGGGGGRREQYNKVRRAWEQAEIRKNGEGCSEKGGRSCAP